MRNDSDAAPLDIDWSKAILVIPPKKKAISIRVDEDVLDYFKHEGAGYQRRIKSGFALVCGTEAQGIRRQEETRATRSQVPPQSIPPPAL